MAITKPLNKFELADYDGNTIMDVTNDVASWQMLEVILKREKLSGASTEVSFPIKFAREAKDYLSSEFEKQDYTLSVR